jgi:hypothetical protein
MPSITVDYGPHSQAVLLIEAMKVLDNVVDWAVQETCDAIESEEEPRGTDTVGLPEQEGADGRGQVGSPPPGEG